ncbi:MAG TPA: cytochrome c3 family protein [Chloroflexota bacterium]
MRRLPLLAVPALVLAGFVFMLGVALPWLLGRQNLAPTPTQPIAFDHHVHVAVAGLDCAFCHRAAATGVTAGLPDLEQCMFCHQAVGAGVPEIEKVRRAWEQQQPVDWERVHRLPDHTRFPHEAHIQAGVACQTCHGDVGDMRQVLQARPLRMGDCVSCHQAHGAPTQCGTCHY